MEFLKQIIFNKFAFFIFFLFSAGTMVAIDYLLNEKAEFLNAWHFIKTILGISSERELQYFYFQDELGYLAIPVTLIILILIHGFISLILLKSFRSIFINLC